MHPLAIWHLEQPDQSGRIVLPVQLERLEMFGPMLPVGTHLTARGWVVDYSARHFTHGVEAYLPDGKLWCRFTGARYWRFYLPFGEFNFHGPKDAYFLSSPWKKELRTADGEVRNDAQRSAIRNPQSEIRNAPLFPFSAPFAVIRLEPPANLLQVGMREVTGHITLTPAEFKQLRRAQGSPERLNEWLFGRIAAKDAVRALWWQEKGERLFPADIEIEADQYGRPSARRRLRDGAEKSTHGEAFPGVSISHSNGLVAALAAFRPRVGLDIERIVERSAAFTRIALNDEERTLLDGFADRHEGLARFWCAKEAASKALGRGLVEGAGSLIIRAADPVTGQVLVALGPLLAKTFPELARDLMIVWTARDEDWALAATLGETIPV